MRSAVIVTLFLFSILFLGAQAAQLDPPKAVTQTAPAPAQPANTDLLQPAGFSATQAD